MPELINVVEAGFGRIGGLTGIKKIFKGGTIAGGGAAVYGGLVASGVLPDLPGWAAAFVAAGISAGINFLKVWLLKFDIKLNLDQV